MLNDTEEEDEGDKVIQSLGVRAARNTRATSAPATLLKKGPILDESRRIVKDRQAKESILPSTKTLRSGTYRNTLIEGVEEQEIPESQRTETTVRGDNVAVTSGALIDNVKMINRPALKNKKVVRFSSSTESGFVSQKLTKTLTQVKNTGAHQLAAAVLKQEVSISVENLLIGLSDIRKLIFSAKEQNSNKDDIIIAYRDSAVPRRAAVRKAQCVRLEDNNIERLNKGSNTQDLIDIAACPQM